MLGYVSREVDRLKELFRGKEAGLAADREAAVQDLATCRAELAGLRRSCDAAAAEAACKLEVRMRAVKQCMVWGAPTGRGPAIPCMQADRHLVRPSRAGVHSRCCVQAGTNGPVHPEGRGCATGPAACPGQRQKRLAAATARLTLLTR